MIEEREYFVGIALENEARDIVERLRRKIAEKFHVFAALNSPPHITLFYPFKTAVNTPILVGISALARNTVPFTVPILGFGAFGEAVRFLEPAQDKRLVALKDKVVATMYQRARIPERNSFSGFHFHITLAFKDLTPAIHREIVKLLETEPLPIASLYVNALTIFRKQQTGKWESALKCSFGDQAS
ncbi:MAG: 2'-5' RNA ligase family protein [bacterium]